MPAGADRGARRRPQGARRAGRRLPGVDRVLGGPAARLRPARHARPGARGRRRRARVLGRAARGVPRRPGSSAAGSTRSPTCSGRSRSPRIPGRRRPWRRSGTPRTSRHALDAVAAFEAAYGAKFPKAVAKITDDLEELLAFYDYPAEHWIHLRTTNPIESTFATVRHRTKITRGPGLTRGRAGHGVQAHRGRPGPLARGQRAHTWSRSSAPAPRSSTASSSNDPTRHPNPKPPKRSSSTGLDDCSDP